MVCEWGMSDSMGPLTFGKKEEQIFLGREIAQHRDYSELTAQAIDAEVKRLVMENYGRSQDLLQRHIDKLYLLAEALLDREVLDGPEIDAIVNNGSFAKQAASAPAEESGGERKPRKKPTRQLKEATATTEERDREC
jgi:cell division protease FtsH